MARPSGRRASPHKILAQRYKRLVEAIHREGLVEPFSAFRAISHFEAVEESDAEPSAVDLPPSMPLAFIASDHRGYAVTPDLYFRHDVRCDEQGRWRFRALDLKIRLWIPAEESHRPTLDHEELRKVERRVGLRIHYDRKNEGQQGPLFHVQVGGKAEQQEHCQLFEWLEEPRIPAWPLDFALAVEMVVRGFFSRGPHATTYLRLSKNAEFRGPILDSQREFVVPFISELNTFLNQKDGRQSLLDHLCQAQ